LSPQPKARDRDPPRRRRFRPRLVFLVLREILRALSVPARLWFYLLRRRHWRAEAASLLEEAGDPRRLAEGNEEARARIRGALGGRRPGRIFLSCGERSGEAQACRLVKTLRAEGADFEISAFGGKNLAKLGVRVEADLVDRAVMGLSAVLAEIPFFLDVVGRFLEILEKDPPDLVVLIDNPGLHLVLAEEAKRRGLPVLYYVCPQYWAWGPWRMARFRRAVDAAIAVLPFEPPFFRKGGIPTGYAGHPLAAESAGAERSPVPSDSGDRRILALLPGSRRKDIDRHLVPMLRVFLEFRRKHPECGARIPQSDAERRVSVADRVRTFLEAEGADPSLCEVVHADPGETLRSCRLALVKSGTTTIQTALAGVPFVLVFKLEHRREKWFASRGLSVPWIGAPNLILGREAFPEHCFLEEEGWERVLASLESLWEDGEAREGRIRDLAEVRARLKGEGADRLLASWILLP